MLHLGAESRFHSFTCPHTILCFSAKLLAIAIVTSSYYAAIITQPNDMEVAGGDCSISARHKGDYNALKTSYGCNCVT